MMQYNMEVKTAEVYPDAVYEVMGMLNGVVVSRHDYHVGNATRDQENYHAALSMVHHDLEHYLS